MNERKTNDSEETIVVVTLLVAVFVVGAVAFASGSGVIAGIVVATGIAVTITAAEPG